MALLLSQEQKTGLGQKMQLSMRLLQMNTLELEACLRTLAEENPFLEVAPPRAGIECSLFAPDERRSRRTEDEPDGEDCLRPVHNCESLRGAVTEQIAGLRVPELMRRELSYLCGEMDVRGYLPSDCVQLSVFCGSMERYENAVRVFQSLEPAGIGARSLSECLCLQLRRRGCEDPLPYLICEKYLDRLAHGQLNFIAKSLCVPPARVQAAKALIATLEPRPSNGYDNGENTPYILPDVEVCEHEGRFEIILADRYVSACTLNTYYAGMADSELLSQADRAYFREKLGQARWALDCVARRREMLLGCTQAILEVQRDFFLEGCAPLMPMTMTALAGKLGVSVSTVSRAARSKYLLCRRGVFPLSYFFAAGLPGAENGTGRDLISGIRALLAQEDPENPLSDRAIAERLSASGVRVSRRTVAKYREREMIPPASARRGRRETAKV